MPVRVRIDVNGQDERTFWIGRWEGYARPDSINTYLIGEESSRGLEPWNEPGWKEGTDAVFFEHLYGDGLVRCVERGLKAWREWDEGE